MTTIQEPPTGTTRRIRVTIEADAQPVGSQGFLRFNTGVGIAVIDPNSSHVTVEDLSPGYEWTDGDVVQEIGTDELRKRSRVEGGTSRWFGGGLPLIIFTRSDAQINEAVRSGKMRVLRHQAGEQ